MIRGRQYEPLVLPPCTIATEAEAPRRVAPAAIIVLASCTSRMPPEAFTPPPRVESALVRLQPHHPLPYIAHDITRFSHIVKEAFTYRRKTLSNALKRLIMKDQLTALGIDLQKRPQDLSVAEFVQISNKE